MTSREPVDPAGLKKVRAQHGNSALRKDTVIIAVAVAILTISLWALANRPESEPAWPAKIQGFSFSPMRAEHDPIEGRLPNVADIEADLQLLAGRTHAIRTYTVDATLGEIPALAEKHGINVALGAWIDRDLERNAAELERLLHIAANSRNVVRVIVGNEAILRGDVPEQQLIEYLERARAALEIPVSTAEPWHVWLKHPELAKHVDYIGIHLLPYWEGIDVRIAVPYVVDKVEQLKVAFPGLPIVIAEVGWPSNGRTRQSAVATEANEAIFLRQFLERAKKEKYTYYLMEAFDQPWKRASEGAVGAYWGVYDVERQPKFEFSKPIVEIPEWPVLAGLSVLVALITLTLLLLDSKTLRNRGRGFLAVVAYAAATTVVWIIYDYAHQYLTVTTVIVGILMAVGMTGVIMVLLTEAHEWAEALWVQERSLPFRPVPVPDASLPKVSIHVPAYNEPPDMLIETLNALAALDYPNYEVVVVDNNTKDPAVWQPVQAHCRMLGPRFHFHHVDPLAGFKSGALNYALAHTSADSELVAVIDSDYIVNAGWLRELAPQFQRPEVAIVQAPQDYRDGDERLFKTMCYAEYRGFFYIGMVTRNARNAIIQHGTMTLVRRSALEAAGGWSEWCITEDAELGLRIFENGHEAVYIPRSYGRGLMPDNFRDYQKQRYRWAYGAMQIMRRHAAQLIGLQDSKLTNGQRYHFIAGWLPWIADGINLLFSLAALTWSAAMIVAPKHVDPPLIIFSILPIGFFIFKIAKLFYLYRGARVAMSVRRTISAAIAGLSLSHTIAKAILNGIVTSNVPFFRTPKLANAHAFAQAIGDVREETLLMLGLWTASVGVAMQQGLQTMDLVVWIVMLLIQSLPYAAALGTSLVSVLPKNMIHKGTLAKVPQ